jgi:hypothetical protein
VHFLLCNTCRETHIWKFIQLSCFCFISRNLSFVKVSADVAIPVRGHKIQFFSFIVVFCKLQRMFHGAILYRCFLRRGKIIFTRHVILNLLHRIIFPQPPQHYITLRVCAHNRRERWLGVVNKMSIGDLLHSNNPTSFIYQQTYDNLLPDTSRWHCVGTRNYHD